MMRLARLAPLVTVAGLGLAAPAGAALPPEDPDAVARCQAAFDAGTEPSLQLATDPPPRSDVRPGAEVRLAASWTPGYWNSLSSVLACVRIVDTVNSELSAAEPASADDGAFEHRFAVPQGLFSGTFICTRIRLDGDHEAVEGTWVSKQACFEVHPEEPPAPAPAPAPPPAPAATPGPAPAPAAAPPATRVAPRIAPSPPTAEAAAPTPITGSGLAGELPTMPPSAPAGPGPVPLLELPRTGAAVGSLAVTGLAALGAGLPAVALGRRRRPS